MKVIILGLLLFFVGCASERQISDAKYEQYQYDRQHFTTDDLVGEKRSRGKE